MKEKLPDSAAPAPENDTLTAYNMGISVTKHRRMNTMFSAAQPSRFLVLRFMLSPPSGFCS